MTYPAHCPLCAANRARLEAIEDDDEAGNPGQPWNPQLEEEIAAIAESYDPETGFYRRARKRKR